MILQTFLALKVGDYDEFQPPAGIPSGGVNSFGNLVNTVIGALAAFGVILALFFVLWAGFNWITSGGDKQKIDKARKTLVWAIAGMIILGCSFIAIRFMNDILGGIGLSK